MLSIWWLWYSLSHINPDPILKAGRVEGVGGEKEGWRGVGGGEERWWE